MLIVGPVAEQAQSALEYVKTHSGWHSPVEVSQVLSSTGTTTSVANAKMMLDTFATIGVCEEKRSGTLKLYRYTG